MTDRSEVGPREPATQPWPAGLTPDTYQPAATAPPSATVPNRKVLVAGAVVVLLIIVAIVGHVVASGNAISVGDCVVTNPSALTGWNIKKVGCNSNPGSGETVQKVVSVQNGSNGQCDLGLMTFQDDPNNKTYCLSDPVFGNG
ncbi:MAG: hypothetical protein ACRD1G_08560 [Acidimicrobiales bacterium]